MAAFDVTIIGAGLAALGPEPNQPNTINTSCADGTAGTFHVDESNDRLKVFTTDGTDFAPGKTVTVQVGYSAGGGYDIVYDTLGGAFTVDAFKVVKRGGAVISASRSARSLVAPSWTPISDPDRSHVRRVTRYRVPSYSTTSRTCRRGSGTTVPDACASRSMRLTRS